MHGVATLLHRLLCLLSALLQVFIHDLIDGSLVVQNCLGSLLLCSRFLDYRPGRLLRTQLLVTMVSTICIIKERVTLTGW